MIQRSLFLLLALAAAPVWAEDAPAEAEGMKPLFNGKDLTGWNGDSRLWSVRDGVIHGETTKENVASGNTFLICTEGDVKNFELRLSFRASTSNNSGIQYRSKHITDGKVRNEWVVRGYQHEIRNENKFPNVSGFIYDEGGKRGRVCLCGEQAEWKDGKKNVLGHLITAEAYQELFKVDEWNDVIIIAKGNNIQHFMNGKKVLDFTDDEEHALLEGIVALQLHAGAPMWVDFKNIRVRNLD